MWPYGHPQHPPMPQLPNYPSFPTSQMHSACPSVMSGTYSSFNPLHPVSVQHLGGMTPPTTSPHSFNSSQCAGFQHACRSIASILWMRSLSAISGTALQPSPCDHPPSSSAGAHFPFGVLLLHRLLFPASATTYSCSPSSFSVSNRHHCFSCSVSPSHSSSTCHGKLTCLPSSTLLTPLNPLWKKSYFNDSKTLLMPPSLNPVSNFSISPALTVWW